MLLFLLACLAPDLSDVRVSMRDGVLLSTDVWLPRGREAAPLVVVRTPYGRGAGRVLATSLNPKGYGVVVQDTRGRGDSGGADCVFSCDGDGELQDGYDTLAWLDEQAWSDGRVVTWGPSALGIVQYLTAPTGPPGLVGMVPSVATGDVFGDLMLPGGVWRESLIEGWLEAQGSSFFLDEIEARVDDPAFWDASDARDVLDRVTVPGLHVGGWYDIALAGTVEMFVGLQGGGGEGARGEQRLVIGPWTHGGVGGRSQGELTYPAEAADAPYGLRELELALLDAVAPVDEGPHAPFDLSEVPAVQYYVLGDVDDPEAPGNLWREAEAWPPPATPTRWHLRADGGLTEGCPASDEAQTTLLADPLDPAPSVCGANLLLPAGPCDQREVDARADVAVFETPPLAAPMEITGHLSAALHVTLDQVDTDLIVRVSDVYPDGRVMLLLDGAQRVASRGGPFTLAPVTPGERLRVDVELAPTSVVLAAGHRLRVSISTASAPRHGVNRNNGLSLFEMRAGEALPVTLGLHHEAGAASYIELPVPEAAGFTACDG